MPTLLERTAKLWDKAQHSAAQLPARIAIPYSQTDKSAGEPFQPDRYYFQVRVNEMYLQYGREWFSTYLPLVMFTSEFTYNRQRESVPFVVGPELVEKNGTKLPDNSMVFTNTRVAGLHPYRGGRLTVTAVLYRSKRTDYIRNLLRVVENAANLLDFSTSLGVYTKIASVVLDGLEALFDVGDTDPIMGWRQEFDPDAGDALLPGYFALINKPETAVDAAKLWVKDNQLCYGDSLSAAKPYRDADYVLFSLAQTDERSDVEMLPFQSLWDRVEQAALEPSDDHWKSAKANMLSLFQTLTASPDLTARHAKKLADDYKTRMIEAHQRAVEFSELPSFTEMGEGIDPAIEETLNEAVSILDL